ncbi:sugar phosphate isomerase/epimerase family protein [Halomicrobium urmianum]|uniref:sugar phosphate isomerase/epimerase family protein n=1 Tax=Halomicrobium urmianum TaxID=1586233 RepID=UPI001CD943C8|nr:sugar phosphate isomerase/epimerase [Halomicrobium urmianum]
MDAIQLYTLREIDAPVTELLERVSEAGFDGVEYAYRVPEADPEAVRDALAETGLRVPAAHVPIEDLEGDLEATVDRYRDLRCERLVVPYLDDEHFADEESVTETAERLEALADRLDEHDVPLLYHNHDAEFTELAGGTAFDTLVAETQTLDFELDVGLAASAGTDPAELIESYGGRIELLHCTDADFDDPDPAHVSFGEGDVDYGAVFDAAADAGIEWYVYENGSTDEPAAELAHAGERFVRR